MAQYLGHVRPEQLAQELKILVNVGLRPPKVRAELHRLPQLVQLVALDPLVATDWDIAIAIARRSEASELSDIQGRAL